MGHNIWIKKFSVVFVSLLFLPHLITATQVEGHEDILEVRHNFYFSADDLNFDKLGIYDLIYMKDASVFSELGKPVLPMINIRIAIPAGTEVIEVRALPLNSIVIPEEFYIMPGQPPLQTSEKDVQLSIDPDVILYNSRLYYPEKLSSFIMQTDLVGQEIAEIILFPVQYVPADKKLIFHEHVELIIKCKKGKKSKNTFQEKYYKFTEHKYKLYEEMLKTMVINPEDVVIDPPLGEMSRALPPGTYDHVIITSSALSSYFQPLVDWHTKKGTRDTVVTTDWIYANYAGPGDTLKIRQFIIDAAGTWSTIYFLLGGETSIVPFAYRNYYENTPSDQYYSDYDDDWTNEVKLGRASVDAAAEVTTFVNKVLKYEKDPPLTNYPLNVLLIGMDADPYTHLENLKETIDGFIPAHFNVTKVYDSHTGNHKTLAINALNAGQNLVNHADHANYNVLGVGDYWHGWGINKSDVNSLTNNNKMSIAVSLGCYPNRIDYTSDCISERFVIYNDYQAGVAFTGNTRAGLYYQGQPHSLSGALDRDWWKGVFTQGKDDLGKAINYSKHQFGHYNDDRKHCEWTFNLLGEPAMVIWTDSPGELDVTHKKSILPQSQNFTVEVKDNGLPIEQALVCLMKGNQVYEVGNTGSDGKATLFVNPSKKGKMYVTVTANNYLPYEGICYVGIAVVPEPPEFHPVAP